MGWSHAKGASRKDIVAEIKAGCGSDLVASRLVGNQFWVVVAPATGPAQILLFLLRSDRGFGYGYKDMTEGMHPYYYDCPLSYLDLAPVACQEWRDAVRKQAALRASVKNAKPGDRCSMVYSHDPRTGEPRLRWYVVQGVCRGGVVAHRETDETKRPWRVRTSQMDSFIPAPQEVA